MQKKYNMIDIGKVIMALCVVAIHTQPLAYCSNKLALSIYDSFVNLAVPFFFLTSGFLLANKLEYPFSDERSICSIKKYLFKMIRLYLLWNLIYLPLTIKYFFSYNCSIGKFILVFIRGILFKGEQYYSWHLWYLLSVIYSIILLIILLKYTKLKVKGIAMVGIVLFIMGALITYMIDYRGGVCRCTISDTADF